MDGLHGLGAINDSKQTGGDTGVLSSAGLGVDLNKQVEDNRLFNTDISKFNSNSDFYNYVWSWMSSTGVLAVEADGVVFARYDTFNVRVINDVQAITYKIIPCLTDNEVTELLGAMSSANAYPMTSVIVSFKNFSFTDKQQTYKGAVELIGLDDIYSINNTIMSPSTAIGAGFGSSFIAKLCKALSEKYKAAGVPGAGNPVDGIGESLSNVGSDLGSSFKEGFEQIKSSFGGLLAGLGIGGAAKNAQAQQAAQAQQTFGDRAITPTTPVNTGAVGTVGAVETQPMQPETMVAQPMQSEPMSPGVRLTKDKALADAMLEEQYKQINASAGYSLDANGNMVPEQSTPIETPVTPVNTVETTVNTVETPVNVDTEAKVSLEKHEEENVGDVDGA